MIAPDETTFAYLKDRQYAPAPISKRQYKWRQLVSDPGAKYDRTLY